MTTPAASQEENHSLSTWQIVMLFLCVYVLIALFIDVAFKLNPETSALLTQVDNAVCMVFLGDFLYNLVTAKNRLAFMKWGWIDLVSSIPNLQVLRWGRAARLIRILRIMRGIRSIRFIFKTLFINRAKGTLVSVMLLAFTLLVFSSILILDCEDVPEANIKTASDALWWSFASITTVGYGDKYPVTVGGRLIAAILMTVGVGLFGTLTAYMAATFVGQNDDEKNAILSELRQIKQQLTELQAQNENRR